MRAARVRDPGLAPAFYATTRHGGWRDWWALLHPPYTVWHLSYVLIGAGLSPAPDPRIVAGALLAFGLAVGVGAHAFDELNGRPLRTTIPAPLLVVVGTAATLAALALGVVAAAMLGPLFLAFVVVGGALVPAYAFEVPLVHSELGFAVAWGGFPVATAAIATGAHPVVALLGAAAATLFSLAQRRLSTRVRTIRRRTIAVHGEIEQTDGSREPINAASLIAAPEAALGILPFALLGLGLALLASRWLA